MAQVDTPALVTGGRLFNNSGFTTSLTVDSFTPSADVYLVACCACETSRTISVAGTHSYTTDWTSGNSEDSGAIGTDGVRTAIWWAKCAASPGAGTVTATFSGNTTPRLFLCSLADTEVDVTTPVPNTESDTDASSGTTIGLTWTVTPQDNSIYLQIAAGAPTTAATTSVTGGTEIAADLLGGGLPTGCDWFDGSSDPYGATFGATQANGMACSVVEFQETQASPANPPRPTIVRQAVNRSSNF